MLLFIIVAGDAAVQAAVTLKPCSDVKNLPLDHFPNLLYGNDLSGKLFL